MDRQHARNREDVHSRKEAKRLKIYEGTVSDDAGDNSDTVNISDFDKSGNTGGFATSGTDQVQIPSEELVTPIMSTSLPEKRKISDSSTTSFGLQSTHGTPEKVVKAEPTIQYIANLLILEILDAVYDSNCIDMTSWVQERSLCYVHFHQYVSLIYGAKF